MFNRLGHAMLILALLGATGTHWVMLQSIAWAAMLTENAREATISEAFEKTFDGKHPCSLCKEIAKGQQSEKKSDQRSEIKRLDFVYQPSVLLIEPSSHLRLFDELRVIAGVREEAPPTRPPRSLA